MKEEDLIDSCKTAFSDASLRDRRSSFPPPDSTRAWATAGCNCASDYDGLSCLATGSGYDCLCVVRSQLDVDRAIHCATGLERAVLVPDCHCDSCFCSDSSPDVHG